MTTRHALDVAILQRLCTNSATTSLERDVAHELLDRISADENAELSRDERAAMKATARGHRVRATVGDWGQTRRLSSAAKTPAKPTFKFRGLCPCRRHALSSPDTIVELTGYHQLSVSPRAVPTACRTALLMTEQAGGAALITKEKL